MHMYQQLIRAYAVLLALSSEQLNAQISTVGYIDVYSLTVACVLCIFTMRLQQICIILFVDTMYYTVSRLVGLLELSMQFVILIIIIIINRFV